MLMLFAPIATFAQKFGHINSQTVIESLPEYVKARAEVEGQAKAYDNDLQAMQKEIQTKAEAYDKNQSTMQPIISKLQNAIKSVGKAGGYVYIMDVSSGIPYISDSLSKDVTAEVKAEMNKLK